MFQQCYSVSQGGQTVCSTLSTACVCKLAAACEVSTPCSFPRPTPARFLLALLFHQADYAAELETGDIPKFHVIPSRVVSIYIIISHGVRSAPLRFPVRP